MTYFDGMENKPNINLRNNRLPKFKRWYIVKVIFYVIVLIIVMCFLWYSINSEKKNQPNDEIEGVEISL